jgi:hypothetical protein
MVHTELSLEALMKQARGACKSYLAEYKRTLDGSQTALVKVLEAAIKSSQVAFSGGLGLTDPKVLAQWASDWGNYDLMLSEFMLSVPSILIKQGLMKACIEMTDNHDLLTLFATRCIKEDKPKTLESLYEAGYRPVFDAHEAKDFTRVVQDVAHLKRELFLPFVIECIESYRQSVLVGQETVMSMVGRYLGCKGGAGATYQAFKADVWPALKTLDFIKGQVDENNVVLQAVSSFTTQKTVSLLKIVAKECQNDPGWLVEKGGKGGSLIWGRSALNTHNPYLTNEVATHIPVEALLTPVFFNMIVNESMHDDFMCHTLPRLLESKLPYQEIASYQKIRDMAASIDMVSMVHDDVVMISQKAAILHVMCLDNDRFDSLFEGLNSKAALYLFDIRAPFYLEASGRPPYRANQYFAELGERTLEEIEGEKRYLQTACYLGNSAPEIADFGLHFMEQSCSVDVAISYLEHQEEMTEQLALQHCEALVKNKGCQEKDAQKLLRTIKWRSESILADALSEDLGL